MLQAPRLPPGFKPCQRNSNEPTTGQYAATNQTSYEDKDNRASGTAGYFIRNLNSNQYHQLMSMFSNHLAPIVKFSEHQDVPTTSYFVADSQLMVTFFPNHFMIEEPNNLKTIGRARNLKACTFLMRADSIKMFQHVLMSRLYQLEFSTTNLAAYHLED